MPDLRIHEAGIEHDPLPKRLRIHDAGVTSTPDPETPTLRIHEAGVTLGLPPATSVGIVWARINGAWVKCRRYLRVGGNWISESEAGTGDPWPTLAQVGPRQDPATYPTVGNITTTAAGQVIEKVRCTGTITILHSNVIVRDVYMNNGPTGDGQYWIRTDFGGNVGNILIEHVEIDAPALSNGIRSIAMNFPGVNSGGVTIKNCYVHGVGSGPRFYNNCHIQDSIVEANFYAGSSNHRSGIGNNGGASCSIRRCRIECKGTNSSAAISLYGDNAVCSNHVFEDNLLICADGFIGYGGSTPGKPFPTGNNVVYRRNRFAFLAPYSGPLYGAITDFTPGVNGCVSEGNTWVANATLDNGTTVTAGQPI